MKLRLIDSGVHTPKQLTWVDYNIDGLQGTLWEMRSGRKSLHLLCGRVISIHDIASIEDAVRNWRLYGEAD